jgi:Ca2+-binding EF-hand superfamily protein
MFDLFDQNGDGAFDQMEFESAIQVLEIDIKLKDLRRLIILSDENQDGKVDVNEFTNMLYSDVQEDDGQVGLDMDSD